MRLLELTSLLCLPAFLVLDLLYRSQPYRRTRFWRLRAFLVSACVYFASMEIAGFWATQFADWSLLDLSRIGTVWGALCGIFAYELGHYAYHRAAHKFDWLWRYGHQMHHSAESLDAFGAYYLSPLDTVAFTTIGSLVFFPLLGLTLEAGLIANTFVALSAVFQHANLKTPRWLGYIVQRPESHSLHHGRGVHAYNYADLPLIDMLFGSFANPDQHRSAVGFWQGASARLGAMLIGRDVSVPPQGLAEHRTEQGVTAHKQAA